MEGVCYRVVCVMALPQRGHWAEEPAQVVPQEEQVLQEVQDISLRERAAEYLMLSLRTTLGIQKQDYEKQYRMHFAPLERALEGYKARGLAGKTADGRWRLSPEGFLLSNTIITELHMIQEQTEPFEKYERA